MAVAADAAARLRALAEPVVAAHGLVCEDASVRQRGGRTEALIVVDMPDATLEPVDLDALADVSRELSEAVDRDDSFMGDAPYDLEVSTPGAERELTELRHFRRARGRLIRAERTDGTELIGRILRVADDGTLTLRPETIPGAKPTGAKKSADPVEVPAAELARAQVLLEFSPPADLDDLRAAIEKED